MLMGFIVSLFVGVVTGHFMIPILRRLKFGQEVRDDGPQSHLAKQGTPTMGGILFFIAVPLGLIVSGFANEAVGFLLGAALMFGVVGLMDDGLKIILRQSEGLTAKQKIALQFVFSLLLILWGVKGLGLSTALWIPFGHTIWEIGWLYWPLMLIVIIGTTNACNLTDGLDGLLSMVTLAVLLGYLAIALYQGDRPVAVFASVVLAACVAFLVFNRYPAKVFMGDTGSFFLGGAVAALAMATKTELLLLLLGFVYVVEALSDIIQVLYFKKTRRRIFLMAPLHHHFELKGLKEVQVVLLFSGVALVCALLAVMITLMTDPQLFIELKGG